MKTSIVVIFLSIFFISCSPKLMPIENGKFHYYKKQSFHYLEIDVELYADDSIKINTNKGGYNRNCIGLIKRIKKNAYQVICYDSRDSSSSNIGNLIQRFNIENDTLIFHKSYVRFWGVKLKRAVNLIF